MQRFFLLWLIAGFFVAGFCSSALAEQGFHQEFLSNGLRVFVIEDHSSPVVAHGVSYNVGSVEDPIGKAGIAHLLEHLMFSQTEYFDANALQRFVVSHGGVLNAHTTYGDTFYFSVVGRQHLEEIMRFEAGRMKGLPISEEALESEKKIVLEELKMRKSPQSRVWDAMVMQEECGYSYRRPIIGWEDEINSVTLYDIEAFYEAYYHPGNAVLLIVGDVNVKDVMRKVRQYYEAPQVARSEPYTRTAAPLVQTQKCECEKKVEVTVKDPRVQRPTFFMELNILPQWVKQRQQGNHRFAMNEFVAAMQVFWYTLGGYGNEAGRLQKRLLYEEVPLAASVGLEQYYPYIPYVMVWVTPLSADVLPQIPNILREEILEEIRLHGVTQEELDVAKGFFKAYASHAVDGVPNAFDAYYTRVLLALEDEALLRDPKVLIENLTLQRVNDLIRGFLGDREKASAVGYLIPEEGE